VVSAGTVVKIIITARAGIRSVPVVRFCSLRSADDI